jgi:hypothetical protein
VTEPSDLVILLVMGAITFPFGLGFRALPTETQRRWRPRIVVISGAVGILALIVWVKLLLDYPH